MLESAQRPRLLAGLSLAGHVSGPHNQGLRTRATTHHCQFIHLLPHGLQQSSTLLRCCLSHRHRRRANCLVAHNTSVRVRSVSLTRTDVEVRATRPTLPQVPSPAQPFAPTTTPTWPSLSRPGFSRATHYLLAPRPCCPPHPSAVRVSC
jgi:hypothetical protein